MKRVIISGATGTVGTALIDELVKNNIEVLVLCRENSKRLNVIPKHNLVTVKGCSLSDFANLQNDMGKDFDVFYHFAWEGTTWQDRNDMYLQNKNVEYTLDAVHTAKRFGCHTFIGAGSQAEYGRAEGVLKSETPCFAENGYGMAKYCAGQMTKVLCGQLGMKHIWVRILSIYGKNDGENTMVMSTINKLKKGEIPKLTKGEQMWDYLYSGDAAKALRLLGEKGVNGKVYPLGSGRVRPLAEYIKDIRDVVAPNGEIELGAIPYAENQVMHLCADITELQKDVGWAPQTDFKEGIRNILK